MKAPATIVTPTAADAPTLAALSASTFAEAYVGMAYYTQAIVDSYTRKAFTPDAIGRDLTDPRVRFFMAVTGGEAVAYAKLVDRPPADCVKDLHGVYLERIYVAKAHQGHGLGTRLLEAAYAEARGRGYRALWLGVWEHNLPAIRYYETHGFRHAGEWAWGFDGEAGTKYLDRDLIMVINL